MTSVKVKVCAVCKTAFFDPKHPKKILCSRKCAGIHKRTVPFKKCPKCNKAHRKPGVYCSFLCARKAGAFDNGIRIRTRYARRCEVCNSEFETVPTSSKQYCCSRRCSFKRRKKQPESRICLFCKNVYVVNRKKQKYCSKKCAGRHYSSLKIKKYGYQTIPQGHRQKTRELFGNRCVRCQWGNVPEILELHHKDRNRKNNNLKNIELLCPTCHSLEHYYQRDGQFSFDKRKR